ncbi:MAG: endonuclease/exonuclease/phosphatase family protein [Akkermansia sp.]
MISSQVSKARKRRIYSVEALLVALCLIAGVFVSGIFNNEGDAFTVSPLHVAQHEYGGASLPSAEKQKVVKMPRSGAEIRFLHLNVCNYFVEEDPKRSVHDRSIKSIKDRDAVADVIAAGEADVVGLCEMGGNHALADLQARLEKRGKKYPYGFVLERAGEERALAMLSRYPFHRNDSRQNVTVPEGNALNMLRGILDVTVDVQDGRMFRFLGVHLKSKRDLNGTADTVRRRESYAVRLVLNEVIASSQGMPLLVFGDFNDGPTEPAVQIILGKRAGKNGLTRLKPLDSRGERWTIFYGGGEEYLSYDHLLVNRTLRTRIGRSYESGIIDIPQAKEAGDHRALWVDLR